MDHAYILHNLITFILSLYGIANLARKIVQNVIDFVQNFICIVILPQLKSDVIEAMKIDDPDDRLHEINKCFQNYSDLFKKVQTESNRFKILKTKGFVDYKYFKIGAKPKDESSKESETENMYGLHVPLKETIFRNT